MANEIDEMEKFLKVESSSTKEKIVTSNAEIKLGNGELHSEIETKEETENDNTTETKAEENGDEKVEESNDTNVEANNEQNEEQELEDN